MIDKNPNTPFFFAFGALHFFGKNNVLKHLRSAGYKVTQIGPNESLNPNYINEKSSGDKITAENLIVLYILLLARILH